MAEDQDRGMQDLRGAGRAPATDGPVDGAEVDAGDEADLPEGLIGILDVLEQTIESARAMPMSSSVLVNRAELLELIDRARAVLPQQLGRADELLAGADDVLADAQVEAEAIVAAARERS